MTIEQLLVLILNENHNLINVMAQSGIEKHWWDVIEGRVLNAREKVRRIKETMLK